MDLADRQAAHAACARIGPHDCGGVEGHFPAPRSTRGAVRTPSARTSVSPASLFPQQKPVAGVEEKSTKYTNAPLGRLGVIEDFLPPPSELVFREDTEKVTIALSKRSVDFFKREARLHRTQYQRMIRSLLDRYAEAHAKSQK